jgi:Amt family ammonium transporter
MLLIYDSLSTTHLSLPEATPWRSMSTHNMQVSSFSKVKSTNLIVSISDIYTSYVYLMICAFLVYMIIPGIGLLYGGLAHKKSGLSLLFQSMMVGAIVTFQWMFWGYSLAFSRTAGPFIGDLANFGLRNVAAAPSPGSAVLPEIVFCLYELLFAACTVQIVVGGAFERGRILPSLIFAFCWVTVVYCPIACWTWNANGWLYKLPSLDYAGGGEFNPYSLRDIR